jgi:transposase
MSLKYSKISRYKIKKIIHCFCLDLTATQCSELLKINRNTVNRYYLIFRKEIYAHRQSKLDFFLKSQDISLSLKKNVQTTFQKKEKRKWFIGIYENEQIIFTNLIEDNISVRINQVKNDGENLLENYGIHRYDAFISRNKLIRLNKLPYNGTLSTLNNIERFWGHTKKRLNKFNGVNNYYELHLKECEWRWLNPIKNMERELKKLILTGLSFLFLSKYFFETNLSQIF